MGLLLSIWAHHQEPAEPDLLDKIQNQLDAVFGLGPGILVVLFGLVIVLIPVSVLGFYYVQRRRF